MSLRIKKQLEIAGMETKPQGHEIMDIMRFNEDTKHMIIFDVIKDDCPVGFSGEHIRIFLSEEGYEDTVSAEKRGEMKIRKHFRVRNGHLTYAGPKRTGFEMT